MFSCNFILVTDFSHGRILQIDLHNGTVVKLPLSINKATGLAFDKSTMKLFFSDRSRKRITSTSLHGKDTAVFYTPGMEVKWGVESISLILKVFPIQTFQYTII